jgi:hypothetical protein
MSTGYTPRVPLPLDRVNPRMSDGDVPPDLLDCSVEEGMITLAVMLSCPRKDPEASPAPEPLDGVFALRRLALYASGAAVHLHGIPYRGLVEKAQAFIDASDATLMSAGNYVLRQARARFEADAVCKQAPLFIGRAELSPLDISQFDPLGGGLSAEFHQTPPNACASVRTASHCRRAITYAALFAPASAGAYDPGAEAVVVLALYSAGARITLDRQTFRNLAAHGAHYVEYMRSRIPSWENSGTTSGADQFEPGSMRINVAMAAFCLRRAEEVAQQSGLIESSGE